MKYKLLLSLSSLFLCTYTKADVNSFFLDIKQMDRYGKENRINILNSICESKKSHNLVIINQFDQKGDLNEKLLDQVQPYYKCFDNIFFSVDSSKWQKTSKDWKDTKYYNAVMDKNFIQKNLENSLNKAKIIKKKYPNLDFNWYINYEANLNYLANNNIKEGYKYYLKNISELLYNIKKGKILWSPAFWVPYDRLSEKQKEKIISNLNDLFTATPKINWLHFQDFLGQTSYLTCSSPSCLNPTIKNKTFKNENDECKNTKGNYSLLENAVKNTNIENLKVNMELFIIKKGKNNSYIPAPKNIINDRIECYIKNNIPIGISFEMIYWKPEIN